MRQKPQNQQKATERFMKTPIESLTLQWQQISWGETHTPNGCTRNLHPRLNLQLDRVGVNVLGTYIVFGRGSLESLKLWFEFDNMIHLLALATI